MSSYVRIALCLAALTVATGALAADSQTEYYAILVDGQKVGHMSRSRTVESEQVTTAEAMELVISRAGMAMTVRQVETSIETLDGKPLAFESVQSLAGMEQAVKGTVSDGKIQVTTLSAGQPKTVTRDYPAGALMAEALRQYQKAQGLAAGTQYTLNVFIPSMMNAMPASVSVGPAKRVDLLGRVVKLPEVTTTIQGPTGQVVSTSYVDENMIAQKTVVPVMGMTLEMIACDKSVAMGDNAIVDFLDKTLLDSPAAIPPDAKAVKYTLKPTGKQKLTDFISTDSQSVRSTGSGGLTVNVTPAKAAGGVKFPYEGDDEAAMEALKPNRYIESDNATIIELARKAVGDAKDAAVAAHRIETFVRSYIYEKSLAVGYASAAEVAESREGDCTEHALLTAAMCRAAGIPARVVAGYLFVPQLGDRKNVFGGHAWTEAFIGGKWIGLDAANSNGFDAGHIAQAVGHGEPTDFFQAMSTMGYFKIVKVDVKK